MNTELRKMSMPLNRWIAVAGQLSTIVEKTRAEGVARMVSGGAGLNMVQAARQAANLHKELLAEIDRRFDELGRSEMVFQQEMAREELLDLGTPSDTEMADHAQLREDTERLLADTTTKIQEMGRRSLEFSIPGWIAEKLSFT